MTLLFESQKLELHLRGKCSIEHTGAKKVDTSSCISNTCFVRSSFMAFNRLTYEMIRVRQVSIISWFANNGGAINDYLDSWTVQNLGMCNLTREPPQLDVLTRRVSNRLRAMSNLRQGQEYSQLDAAVILFRGAPLAVWLKSLSVPQPPCVALGSHRSRQQPYDPVFSFPSSVSRSGTREPIKLCWLRCAPQWHQNETK